ncbi:MAG: alpha/beta hydrolase [Microbacteriaceae bacterium]|nr:alpha/beta hydrolase [Microbacteriaceae bacterium]
MIARAWAWLLDYVYAVRVQAVILLGRGLPPSHEGEAGPVLLIPGVYERWQFMRPVALRLAAAGHPIHVVEPLGYNRTAVSDAAEVAQRYLDDHDLHNVTIVAHSKGGLIGKHMMLVNDRAGRIDRMVAIATPFNGSSYARFLPGRTLRAFMPTETTLAMLGANAEVNSRIVSIFGAFDPHIPGGSALAGATNLRMPVSGHFRILADAAVLAEVESAARQQSA